MPRTLIWLIVLACVAALAGAGCSSQPPDRPSRDAAESRSTIPPKVRAEAIAEVEDHVEWCAGGNKDISCADWDNVAIPGSVCGLERDVQLRDGQATVESPFLRGEPVDLLSGTTALGNGVEYGDLDGDGKDEAALSAWCKVPRSSTSGQLGQEWVVFTGRVGRLRAIGSVAPQYPDDGEHHVPYVSDLLIAPGRIVAEELFYGDYDAMCCPTGRAITTWEYKNGKLSVLESTVVRQPDDRER